MIFKLLSAPITGPLKVISIVAEEAEKEFYNSKTILSEYEQLRKVYKEKGIGEKEYKEQKKMLNERLKISMEKANQGGS